MYVQDRKSTDSVVHVMYLYIEVPFHSTVHWTGRFYCLLPAVCSLHHRCRSLQSCRLYWRDCVDHLWEYQGHCSQQLGRIRKYMPCSDNKNSDIITNHLRTITSCRNTKLVVRKDTSANKKSKAKIQSVRTLQNILSNSHQCNVL